MLKYFLIAIGGGLGSMARFWVTTTVGAHYGQGFPYGTLTVNLVACLAIGFLITSATRRAGVNSAWRFFVAVGFIGAFSTFSTFEWETFSATHASQFLVAAEYAAVSLILGMLCVWAGTMLAHVLAERA